MPSRQRKQYLTAAAKRRRDPFLFSIDDHWFAGVDNVDLAEFGPLVDALRTEMDDDMPAAEKMRVLSEKRDEALAIIRRFVEREPRQYLDDEDIVPTEGHAGLDAIRADTNLRDCIEVIRDLIGEYSGANPTSPSESGTTS